MAAVAQAGWMKVHRCEAVEGCGCTCASGATRTGRRSCSSTVCRKAICAGTSSSKAPSRTSSGSWLRPSWSRHVRGAARGRALHRRRALGRRRRRDPRSAPARPAGAGRLVVRPLRHLRLRALARPDRIGAIEFVGGAVKLGEAAFGTLLGPGFSTTSPTRQPRTCRPTSAPCAAWSEPSPRRHSQPQTSRHCCARAWRCRRKSAPTWAPATSTATTCSALSRCLCWSRMAWTTRSFPRWPSTSSQPVRPPRPPGTRASLTPHLEKPERFNRELADLTRRVRA